MTNTNFLTATVIVQALSTLVALIIFIITPKEGRKEFLWLGLALLFSFLTDLISFILYFGFRINANLTTGVGSLLANSCYFLFYRGKFKSTKIRPMIVAVLILYVAFALINMFSIQGLTSINSYTFTLKGVALIIISLTYFYVLIRELPTEKITQLPMFWINTGVLIFFSGTFFHWLLTDYMVNVLKGNIVNTWTIKNSLGVMYYAILSVGLWHNRAGSISRAASHREYAI